MGTNYVLASVNGRELPSVNFRPEEDRKIRIRAAWTGGRAVFRPDGRYSIAIHRGLQFQGRLEPVGSYVGTGEWHATEDGRVELRTRESVVNRWQLSRDRSVLVGYSGPRGDEAGDERTIFVFHRDGE